MTTKSQYDATDRRDGEGEWEYLGRKERARGNSLKLALSIARDDAYRIWGQMIDKPTGKMIMAQIEASVRRGYGA